MTVTGEEVTQQELGGAVTHASKSGVCQFIATDDKAEVQRVAQQIAKKGDLMGARAAKKTMLARQVLQELNAGGRVSKKTQLAMEDSARMAEEMPLPEQPS